MSSITRRSARPSGCRAILLLDDSHRMASPCARTLARHGFDVKLASTLAEAESLWSPGEYTLVLLAVSKELARAAAFCESIKREAPRQIVGLLVPSKAELPPTVCPDLIWPQESLEYFLARVETLAALAPAA